MEVHEHRGAGLMGAAAVDVEAVAHAGGSVADVRHPLDIGSSHEERRDQDAGVREPTPWPERRVRT
jgi:hypothetical protein